MTFEDYWMKRQEDIVRDKEHGIPATFHAYDGEYFDWDDVGQVDLKAEPQPYLVKVPSAILDEKRPFPELTREEFERADIDILPRRTLPRANRQTNRRDRKVVNSMRRELRQKLTQPQAQSAIYDYPNGLGKSTFTAKGARNEQRLVITPTKAEAREKYREMLADDEYWEIVPYTDGWDLSDANPLADQARDLYFNKGFMPEAITRWLSSKGIEPPESADTPYRDQMQEDLSEYPLLLGSLGHENVKHFREGRTIFFDDCKPIDEVLANTFTYGDFIDGANEFCRVVMEISGYDELTADKHQQERFKRYHTGFDDDDEYQDELTRRTHEDPYKIDIVDLSLNSKHIDASTFKRMQVVLQVDHDVFATDYGTKPYKTTNEYSFFDDPLYEAGQKIVLLGRDPIPILTYWYFRVTGRDSPIVWKPSLEDMQAYWRAQNLYVLVGYDLERTLSSGKGGYKSRELTRFADEAFSSVVGEEPVVFGPKKALEELDTRFDSQNFARVPSDPQYDGRHLGVVLGAESYGSDWIEMMCSLVGERVRIVQQGVEPLMAVYSDGSTSSIGQKIIEWNKRHRVDQAIGRIGRGDDDLSIVVVGTKHVGREFPAYDVTDHFVYLSPRQRQVYDLIDDGHTIASSIADAMDCTPQNVNAALRELEEMDLIKRDEYSGPYGAHISETVHIEYSIRFVSDICPAFERSSFYEVDDQILISDVTEQLHLASFDTAPAD